MEKESCYTNIGPVAIEWRALALASMSPEQKDTQARLVRKVRQVGEPLAMMEAYLDDEKSQQMPVEQQAAVQDLLDFHTHVFASFLRQVNETESD